DGRAAVGSSQGDGVAGVAEVARGADDEGSAVDGEAADEGIEPAEVERARSVHGETGGAGDGGRNGRAGSRREVDHAAADERERVGPAGGDGVVAAGDGVEVDARGGDGAGDVVDGDGAGGAAVADAGGVAVHPGEIRDSVGPVGVGGGV